MEENQRITYDLDRLAVDPSPSPHKDPICTVVYSSFRFGRTDDTPASAYLELLLPSMPLAQRLLLHPFAMPKLAAIIAASDAPHPLVEMAIRRVLADTQWLVVLDSGGLKSIAQYAQIRPQDMSATYQLKELTIFVNHQHMQRFRSLQTTSQMGEEVFDRHLLYTAVAIAHTLVYAIWPQVHYMLRDSPSVEITYTPAVGSHAGSVRADPDPLAWKFETYLLGGGMDAVWRRNPTPTSLPLNFTPSEGPRLNFGALQARHNERDDLDLRPIDGIIIRQPTAEGERLVQIDTTWVSEIVEAFVHGQVDQIALPPKTNDTPLDQTQFIVCGRGKGDNAPFVPFSYKDCPQPKVVSGGLFGGSNTTASPSRSTEGLSVSRATAAAPPAPGGLIGAVKDHENRIAVLEMAAAVKGTKAEGGAPPTWVTPAVAVLVPLVLLLLYRTS